MNELAILSNINDYNPSDIYNLDESGLTGLNWRTITKKGYVVGNAKRIKISKERILQC